MAGQENRFKILVISDYRAVVSSRPEAEIFIRLAQQGHEIHILSYPEADFYNQRFRHAGITVVEKHPTRKISFAYIRYLRALVKKNQYDFVHAFNSLGLTNAVWALAGVKTKLLTYRGYAGQTYWYDPMMYLKYFHPRVDHIICLSQDIHNILSRHMPWGRHKLTTIHKGHDPEWYADVKPIDRETLGATPDDILVCSVSNVRPFKGIPDLIEAMHHLSRDIPFRLLCIGKGYDQDPVKSLIENSPLTHRIHVLGYRQDALSIVSSCDSLVLSSTHGEALNKSVIEAMCLGIAPVITDIPGNQGLVIHGESGWVVPIQDPPALAAALTDMSLSREERHRRGQNARDRIAKHFHTRQTAADYVSLYEKLR